MNLGVLSVPTWLMLSLLFVLAMYGALAAYIALNTDPHYEDDHADPHYQAKQVYRKMSLSVRKVYDALSPPVKHLWQWLCTDERPRMWFDLLVYMLLGWLFVMFFFHLNFMSWKMYVLVVQVEYNQNTTLSVLGDRFREAFQKSPHNSMLVGGLHIGNGWERVVWPWWTCPFFERFFASFATQWRYVTDWSAAAWFCGWFGMTILQWWGMIEIGSKWFPGNVRVRKERKRSSRDKSPAREPLPTLPVGINFCRNCLKPNSHGCGAQNKRGGDKLHKVGGAWPDPKVLCPPAAPDSPAGSADVNP